jgi:hypothetical protein
MQDTIGYDSLHKKYIIFFSHKDLALSRNETIEHGQKRYLCLIQTNLSVLP